jgi:hypothetical protein
MRSPIESMRRRIDASAQGRALDANQEDSSSKAESSKLLKCKSIKTASARRRGIDTQQATVARET